MKMDKAEEHFDIKMDEAQQHCDMKMDKAEVFFSNIQVGQSSSYEDLYNLLTFDQIPPVKKIESKPETSAFEPRTDKHCTPKKFFTKLSKVKTVRDIRNEYEKEIMEYLPSDLKKQESYLLKKIRTGSAKENDSLKIIKNLINNKDPQSRSTWQILTNLNPENHFHSTQHVLWNGKNIRVTGSKGGEKKFLCNFDLEKKKLFPLRRSHNKTNKVNKIKNLLKTSLLVKFKPGPLSKKTKLDHSHQKIHVGESALVKLPDIGLEVKPSLGVALEPTISNILSTLRDDKNGALTEKWAMFAVSTLGKPKENDTGVTQTIKDAVTFDLDYHNNQNKVLMRCNDSLATPVRDHVNNIISKEDEYIASTVQSVLDDILASVEINLDQDNLFTKDDDESRPGKEDELLKYFPITPKERPKRKCNNELEKLAVTVIRLADSGNSIEESQCNRSFCSYGCICASLQIGNNIKMHCGRVDCMFECKCDFSMHKDFNSFEDRSTEIIPGLLDLDSRISSKLAKEEQKFHQTVIVTEEKSIVLNSQRRNLKTPKRYVDFYKTVNVKNENNLRNDFSIVVQRLDCRNVEPWCMVHNLYKCFCHGKFTERNSLDFEKQRHSITDNESDITLEDDKYLVKVKTKERNKSSDIADATVEYCSSQSNVSQFDVPANGNRRYPERKNSSSKKIRSKSLESTSECYNQTILDNIETYERQCSARTTPYSGRLYNPEYYLRKNNKIKDLEVNDAGLQYKLMRHVMKDKDMAANPHIIVNDENLSDGQNDNSENSCQSPTTSIDESKRFPNKEKIIKWLEANYKSYKQRLQTGKKSLTMEAPKHGKIALYPWEVILERYRTKKNYFLVTKEVPHRTFMVVDLKDPFFDNCIMIDRIPFEELRNYPITVRNLLENADDMKDIFYILSGLPNCWELIGSVTKLRESQKSGNTSNELSESVFDLERSVPNEDTTSKSVADCVNMADVQFVEAPEMTMGAETSKWFAMIIENDFHEIQFCDRGFFVKYENIMNAVSVARVSRKTVRLSPQKTSSLGDGPQFGVYAIPHPCICCAFVGPYERNDPLGFETIPSTLIRHQLRSRGVCIITPKSENVNIIDNPLAYLPKIDDYGRIIYVNDVNPALVPEVSSTSNIEEEQAEPLQKKPKTHVKSLKMLKPIKIRKSNGFYQLAGGNLTSVLKPINLPLTSPPATQTNSLEIIDIPEDPPEMMQIPIIQNTFSLVETFGRDKILAAQNKTQRPVAEIAPQVQISGANKGMKILKPDEINNRFPLSTERNSSEVKSEDASNESNMDIENFLATNEIQTAPNIQNTFVLSDDEDENNTGALTESKKSEFQEVWIECKNFPTLGWIKGRRNCKNELSFEFPGFKYTDFYMEEEAFLKINQVLSRKVYIPNVVNIQWQVLEAEENLKIKHMLKSEDLGPDMILTRLGLRHKSNDLNSVKTGEHTIMSTLDELKTAISPTSLKLRQPVAIINEAKEKITILEKQSKDLEDEVDMLNSERDFRKSEILKLLIKVPEEVRREVTDKIKEFDCSKTPNKPRTK